jgi:hypothetical protein
MEKSLLVRNALVALFVIVAVASSHASSAQNCEDVLNNNRYRCQGNNTFVGPAEVCIEFRSPGEISSQFDMLEDLNFVGPAVLTVSYGCVCNPVGVHSPEFNASHTDFLCASRKDDLCASAFLAPSAIAGSWKGRTLVYRASNANGQSAVYSCTLDPNCEVTVP